MMPVPAPTPAPCPDSSIFRAELRQALAGPLPGQSAQYAFAPRPRPGSERLDPPRADARTGGVLVLFYPKLDSELNRAVDSRSHAEQTASHRQSSLFMPLILRPTYDGTHSGQVGFPGGGQEEMDTDITATALREAYEEVGVEPSNVEVLGHLTSLYISPSNYVVVPTVGWAKKPPRFRTDPYEVAKLLEVPLAELLNPASRQEEEWQLRSRRAVVPYLNLQGQTVWGATAMMLGELLAIIRGLPCVNDGR